MGRWCERERCAAAAAVRRQAARVTLVVVAAGAALLLFVVTVRAMTGGRTQGPRECSRGRRDAATENGDQRKACDEHAQKPPEGPDELCVTRGRAGLHGGHSSTGRWSLHDLFRTLQS